MKVSLSIPDEDIRFLDNFAKAHGIRSRSAAVQHSIALLREAELGDQYEAAWDEWYASEDAALWDSITGDGMTDAEG
ncbi:ribbon-helix-helix domain-containing protein [Glycomyces sp. NRRL B-16210]|uniref:ribbon-helix-helix domain-containing protein n=1 Tax=Glycomyces sp. NRRL B-16210 TaxID=1463821 RepID=UPI0004C17016|nr:ribbon-helix-helix domain-containing protein [Glycomyces sp. NRRL B-16210]